MYKPGLLFGIPLLLACACTRSHHGTDLSFEVEGTAEFTDDDGDVKSLSPGGLVRIEQGMFTVTKSYEVRAGSGGTLYRTYRVRGKEQPLDDSGRRWLADAMPFLIRETGAGAGPRVQRMLRTGGPAAVLNEVRLIESDGSKRIYLRELIEKGHLSEMQSRDAIRAAERISSDGDKAALLTDVAGVYLVPHLREPWFAAAATISSDGDKAGVLEQAVRRDRASAETLNLASKTAGGMGSDGDKAQVLTAIAPFYGPEIRHAYFKTVNSIGSDGDRNHVLCAVLAPASSHPDSLAEVMRSVGGMGSDGDKRQVIEEAARYDLGSEPVRSAFLSAVNTINSDGDRSAALLASLRSAKPGSALPAVMAESATRMGSDGDKAAVLSALADGGITDPALRSAFFAAVNSMNSDGDRSAVLLRVLGRPDVPWETAVAAIESAARLASDGEKAEVLVRAAARYRSDAAVRAAVEKALTSIHSDGDYRRVSDALRG